jgi:squalene-associated FAD-dependent desaturase
MSRTIHIIGAGLAGLAAAVKLTARGESVVIHEATNVAGGRCRSYHDHSIGMMIDNGNHLLLSGNTSALGYLRSIGADHELIGPSVPEFVFTDFKSGARWTLKFNAGRIPWWIFNANKRVPATRALDYLPMGRLLWAKRDQRVSDVVAPRGNAYERLLGPLLLAALNIEPPIGSAALAGAVIRETIATGGAACRPLIAKQGLSHTLIDPALALLAKRNATIRLGHQLHAIRFSNTRAEALDFGSDNVTLAAGDAVILAVPPYAAAALVPGIETPNAFRAIVNAHFRIDPPPGYVALTGVLNATTEWLFAFPGRLSVTISAGDRLMSTPREELAQTIWAEVATITGLTAPLPPWQIVRERRATFAATPEQDARRPNPATHWSNLVLAGDWTNTGLPATIESAIRSGDRAAAVVAGRAGETK